MGGETPIANCRKVTNSIDPAVKKRFDQKGITYKRYYYEKSLRIDALNSIAKVHKTWMEVFNTTDRTEVEQKCESSDFRFQWDKRGGIHIANTLPACVQHPDTKEKIWFNQAHTFNAYRRNIGLFGSVLGKIFYPTTKHRVYQTSFGNGDSIQKADIMKIHDAFESHTSTFQWQPKDILVLDNILTAHGRYAYSGPRKILAAMANAVGQ